MSLPRFNPDKPVLAIDCATPHGGAALADERGVLAVQALCTRGGRSARILPLVGQLLRDHGLTPHGLGGIAVTIGPGSFTGVRVGLSCAQGLAFAADLPVTGVSTLEALACGLWIADCGLEMEERETVSGDVAQTPSSVTPSSVRRALESEPRPSGSGPVAQTPSSVWNAEGALDVCPMLDARRAEVYFAVYHTRAGGAAECGLGTVPAREVRDVAAVPELSVRHPPACRSIEHALEWIERPTIFLGDGAIKYRPAIERLPGALACFAPPEKMNPAPAAVAVLGRRQLLRGAVAAAAAVRPLYLRLGN